jgi:hypothetical protein
MSFTIFTDADCDGTAAIDDCDDTDPYSTIREIDMDCDGYTWEEDCDDTDPDSTTIYTDADCDGFYTADDCDDSDPMSFTIFTDADCDGTAAIDDCDDTDPYSTIRETDADCDGLIDDCSGTMSFAYTGDVQEFIVPACAASVEIDLWGGAGGWGWNPDVWGPKGAPGYGGYSLARIPVTPGELLQVYVGGMGEPATEAYHGLGGFNGGGNGIGSAPHRYAGGGGGGGSDIRRGSTLASRLVVAGGGGGGSGWCTDGSGIGGAGGGEYGEDGQECGGYPPGGAGTPFSGGGFSGMFGMGGSAFEYAGAGGGGGYYGGGASNGSGGGGGSGYTSAPGTTGAVMMTGMNPEHGMVIINWG